MASNCDCLMLVPVLITFQNSLGFLVSGCQSGIFLYIIFDITFCIVLLVHEIIGTVDQKYCI